MVKRKHVPCPRIQHYFSYASCYDFRTAGYPNGTCYNERSFTNLPKIQEKKYSGGIIVQFSFKTVCRAAERRAPQIQRAFMPARFDICLLQFSMTDIRKCLMWKGSAHTKLESLKPYLHVLLYHHHHHE
ncbi:UNVERIFIED_CONTAM: hypothetical protein K2H54_041314 [Gekko kuhli]